MIVGDPLFSETFTAIPNEGYEFKGWAKGDNFFCSEQASNVCTVGPFSSAPHLTGPLIHSERNAYILPIFQRLESPYTFPVVLDGNGEFVYDMKHEVYHSWFRFLPQFSQGPGAWAEVRSSTNEFRWPHSNFYYEGDSCDPSLAYAINPNDSRPGGVAIHHDREDTHFYRPTQSSITEYFVGSRMEDDGVCVDIPDQYVDGLTDLHWLEFIDEYEAPLVRYGPPSCAYYGGTVLPCW